MGPAGGEAGRRRGIGHQAISSLHGDLIEVSASLHFFT